ncbi:MULTISPECIES: hypothetical protein [Flavobacterium]|uniref:Uncharacterized protein n=1 Tax=Flavobacterium beibuense F44-8 TaxID=1406840 RepID=A0A0A2LYJ5_9FLAO|nr:hypothetical protein [Flavobacterium beibuense]KGO84431.1 hypothetical protein Q763_01425 [Flavobacterium beibuense F44-8]
MDISHLLNLFFGSTTLVSVYVAWSSRKAQVQITESTAIQELQKAYATFVQDTNQRHTEMKTEISSLRLELQGWKNKCQHCKAA